MENSEIIKIVMLALRDTEFRVRSYSGRGMYGKVCLGICAPRDKNPSQAVLQILRAHIEDVGDQSTQEFTDHLIEIIDALEDSRTDSMGLGSVIYFPEIAWEVEYEDEDEDEDENS